MGLVASCWFISVHPTFHDARSQEPKIKKWILFLQLSDIGALVSEI